MIALTMDAGFGPTAGEPATARSRHARRPVALVLVALVSLCIACAPAAVPSGSAPAPDGARGQGLVWSDEFDGDLDQWYPDLAANEWTADHPEAITDRPENASIRDGELVISARREPWTDQFGVEKEFTSARLVTVDAFLYGRVEARINAPVGQGFWSAFWLLGVGSWPESGELDIVELLSDTTDAYVTAHGVTRNGEMWKRGTSAQTPSGEPWGGAWHVYGVDWNPDAVVFDIDGQEVLRFGPEDVESDGTFWSFDDPAQIILNLALGAWEGFPGGGEPDATTPSPGELRVDWVRVYDAEVIRHVPRV